MLSRPIFAANGGAEGVLQDASLTALAAAIVDCVDAGARVLNLSVALARLSVQSERHLEDALEHARSRGTILVCAAGNQGLVGSTTMTRHCAVIAVAACDSQGQLERYSNLSPSLARRGLRAPGRHIGSLAAGGGSISASGTSAAVPFVTGTIALLWSLFPAADAEALRLALQLAHASQRRNIAPPLLDAEAAYLALRGLMPATQAGRQVHRHPDSPISHRATT